MPQQSNTPRALVLASLQKWLYISDIEAVDVIMAVALAIYMPGDPLWLYVVGPPSSGKTEVLRQMSGPKVETVSTLTASSLISGFNSSGDRRQLDLMSILDGRLMVIKDFTSILSLKPDDSSRVFADLREAYDGYLEKRFGSGVGTISYHARFGVIAAVTPAIDGFRKVHNILGERFIRIDMRPTDQDRTELTRRALEMEGQEAEERAELSQIVGAFIAGAEHWVSAEIKVLPEITSRLAPLADITAILRTEVARDRDRVVQYEPQPEMGPRIAKQLLKLTKALANWRGHELATEDDYLTAQRVALDCVERRRRKIIGVLQSAGEPMATRYISEALQTSGDTARELCEDLWALEVLARTGEPSLGYTWSITPMFNARLSSAHLELTGAGGAIYYPPYSSTPSSKVEDRVHTNL